MEFNIKIIDSGGDRYQVNPVEITLGRQYDDKADIIVIERPATETNSLCYMLIRDINGVAIDEIPMPGNTYEIRSNVSMNKYVKIGFRFIRSDGYSKGSADVIGNFLPAQRPFDFDPAEPQRKKDLSYLVGYGFTDSKLAGNELQFFNMNGEKVVVFDIAPFTQAQSDLGEADTTRATFIKGKQTSNLENDGADGTSPYATQQYVKDHASKIDVDDEVSDTSENPVQNKVIKEYVDKKQINLDDHMDDQSINGVQNRVVKGYVDERTATITILSEIEEE